MSGSKSSWHDPEMKSSLKLTYDLSQKNRAKVTHMKFILAFIHVEDYNQVQFERPGRLKYFLSYDPESKYPKVDLTLETRSRSPMCNPIVAL